MKNALFALILVAPAVVAAQTPTITPGRRVQFVTTRGVESEGALSSQTADSIVLIRKGSERIAVATADISSLRLSEGKSHGLGALKGMGYGAAIVGGALTLIVSTGGAPEYALAAALVGGLEGAFYGGIIGAIAGAEKWTKVHSGAPRVTLGATPAGAARVGLSFSF
jgi:hypothetical protein